MKYFGRRIYKNSSEQNIVKEFFGKEPSKGVNPDEVVAIGAAIQGGVLTGDVTAVLLLDGSPNETMGSVMTKLIEAIILYLCNDISTAADNQPKGCRHSPEGERPMAAEIIKIWSFSISRYSTAPRGIPQIEVTFDIDSILEFYIVS